MLTNWKYKKSYQGWSQAQKYVNFYHRQNKNTKLPLKDVLKKNHTVEVF